MLSTITVVAAVVAAAIAGYSGYHIAFYFNRTSTAAPSGVRVFEPRNSPFVVLCGSFIGMLCVWLAKMFGVLSTTDFKIAVVVALLAGAAAGIYGRHEGDKARSTTKPEGA